MLGRLLIDERFGLRHPRPRRHVLDKQIHSATVSKSIVCELELKTPEMRDLRVLMVLVALRRNALLPRAVDPQHRHDAHDGGLEGAGDEGDRQCVSKAERDGGVKKAIGEFADSPTSLALAPTPKGWCRCASTRNSRKRAEPSRQQPEKKKGEPRRDGGPSEGRRRPEQRQAHGARRLQGSRVWLERECEVPIVVSSSEDAGCVCPLSCTKRISKQWLVVRYLVGVV